MGFISDITEGLRPYSERLNANLAAQGALLHHRLGQIESRISDLGRADIGDKWVRLSINLTLVANTRTELSNTTGGQGVYIRENEALALQAITMPNEPEPPEWAIINGSGVYLVVVPNNPGLITVGGDVVFLKGEHLQIIGGAGKLVATLHMIRILLPVRPRQADLGPRAEPFASINTHDPARDNLQQRGVYVELPREVVNAEGDPALAVNQMVEPVETT